MNTVRIDMLGEFSLQCGQARICDSDNRSKKVWMLLAYLICSRGRVVPPKELVELLWGDDPSSSNPENALKITFHRTRTMLDRLFPGAGHALIIHRDAGYTWNREIPVELDTDRFDLLCRSGAESDDGRLEDYRKALELYQGDFLEKLSSESWVIPVATHFHNLYVETVLAAGALLGQRGRHREAAEICRTCSASEPYHEPLYRMLMEQLGAAGDAAGAAAVYEELRSRLFNDFGITPGAETRAVYREVTSVLSDRSLPMETVLEQLQEENAAAGALQCEYDIFKVLCHVEARSMPRTGRTIHVALMSVSGSPGKPLSRRSSDRAMEHLGEQIRLNLRRGDVFARCSLSQYIIMLPQANYENSCMVCRRLSAAFFKRHPHSPAKLHFMVQPLTPDISVP